MSRRCYGTRGAFAPALAAGLALLLPIAVRSSDGAPDIELTSITPDGAVPDGDCLSPSISHDGNWVAFASTARNLDPAATSGIKQIYLHSRRDGTTILISRASDSGPAGDGESDHPAVSPDGRYVAFESVASNLLGGGGCGPLDTGVVGTPIRGTRQIYVHDRICDTTELISVSCSGIPGNGDSRSPAISAPYLWQAFWVAFESDATNLADCNAAGTDSSGRGTIASIDVLTRLRDPMIPFNRITKIVSLNSNGQQQSGNSFQPSISYDGRYIAFLSNAGLDPTRRSTGPDVIVRDLLAQKQGIQLRNANAAGAAANAESGGSRISADGRHVVFSSSADNLVPGDTNGVADVFVSELTDEKQLFLERVSVDDQGKQATQASSVGAINADGRFVVFQSFARLVEDRNGPDIYVRDRTEKRLARVGVSFLMAPADGPSDHPVVSGDGTTVAFESRATNLAGRPTDGRVTLIYTAPNPLVAGAPTITEVTPDFGPPDGKAFPVLIRGTNFTRRLQSVGGTYATIFPRVSFGLGILATVVDQAPELLTLNVTIQPDVRPGLHSVTVINPGSDGNAGPSGTKTNAFAVSTTRARGQISAGPPTFAAVRPPAVATGDLTVRNSGDGPLVFHVTSATQVFTLAGISGPYVLQPHRSLKIPMLFAPEDDMSGSQTGKVVISSDDPKRSRLTVDLTGIVR